MKEVKSSEAKVMKRPESSKTARSSGFHEAGAPTVRKSNWRLFETLGPGGRPQGQEAALQRQTVKQHFLLSLSSKWRRKHPL